MAMKGRIRMTFRSILSNPLLQFFAAGIVIFGLYEWRSDRATSVPDTVSISRVEQNNLALLFEKTWRRPPTKTEFDGLIDERLQQELLYREALALGLDRDDVVIRRRLAQKLEFIVDDMTAGNFPSDKELAEFLRQNADRYAQEPVVTFRQVFLSAERRGSSLVEDAKRVLAELRTGKDSSSFSDPTMLPEKMQASSLSAVGRVFGTEFAAALNDVPLGDWAGPVRSTFGAHLVKVGERQAGGPATLDDARMQIERDWREAERQRARAAYMAGLREKYSIVIEPAQDPSE